MRREEEKQISRVGSIASPAITGYFISVGVPEVPVGEDVKATIDFYAINPGALYWATFLIADSPGLSLRELLDKAREIGQEGGRKKTYNLGPMPDKDVAISFFIFAHDDAGYDWDWNEYDRWMEDYSVEMTHLDSEYISISPGIAPPPEVVLSGIITRVEPLQFDVGQPIDLEIDFNAYMESLYYQIRGWETSLQAIVNGLSDSDAQTHYGRDGSRTGETLNLGAMPDRDLSGTLILYGRGLAIPAQDWQELDSKDLVITREGVPPPPCSPGEMKCVGSDLYGCIDGEWALVQENAPECVLPPEKKFPWVAAALIGGGAAIAIAAATKKPK